LEIVSNYIIKTTIKVNWMALSLSVTMHFRQEIIPGIKRDIILLSVDFS
jgi:hypothetical protein